MRLGSGVEVGLNGRVAVKARMGPAAIVVVFADVAIGSRIA